MFVLGFQHHVIDHSGEIADHAPIPNWNDILLARPPNKSCSIKYGRSGIPL